MKQLASICLIAFVVAQLSPETLARPAGSPTPSVTAKDPDCDPPPAGDDIEDYVIDASAPVPGPGSATFEKIGNHRSFGLSKRVRVVVKNKNPFAFKYRLTVEEKVVKETAIAEFFGRLGSFNPLKTEEKTEEVKKDVPAPKGGATEAPPRGASLRDQCEIEAEAIRTQGAALATAAEKLQQEVNYLIELQLGARRAYETSLPLLQNPATKCDRLLEVASNLRDELKKLDDLLSGTTTFTTAAGGALPAGAEKPPRILIRRLLQKADDLNGSGVALKRRIQAYQVYCTDQAAGLSGSEVVMLTRLSEGASAVAAAHKENVTTVAKDQAVLDTALVGLQKVLGDETAFYDIANIGDYDSPTDVNVKLERVAVSDEKAEFAQLHAVAFNFGGGPRFALSGGVVGSPLDKEEFVAVQGILFDANGAPVVDADGKPVLGAFVGRKEGSSSRILPMVFLHGRILDLDWKFVNALHLSAGVTVSNDNKGTDPEFLFGPSLSFIDNNLFLTAGGYVGRVQQLEGNLFTGARIPDDLGDIPVRKDYKWHVGFAISWRFP